MGTQYNWDETLNCVTMHLLCIHVHHLRLKVGGGGLFKSQGPHYMHMYFFSPPGSAVLVHPPPPPPDPRAKRTGRTAKSLPGRGGGATSRKAETSVSSPGNPSPFANIYIKVTVMIIQRSNNLISISQHISR